MGMSKGKQNIVGKSQKGQQVIHMDDDQARAYFETLRWPNGPACVHCGSVNVLRLQGQAHRPGLLECRDCRKQFSVTVGSVMEDSHLPLATWAKAFHLMCSSKKGISALQLQRNLGLGSYRTAWFLAHRIREAMKCEPVAGLLKGAVQVDEAYVGGKPRPKSAAQQAKGGRPRKRGRGTSKTPVLVLVETDGAAVSQPIKQVTADTLKAAMHQCIHPSATIVTDQFVSYPNAASGFAAHQTVQHNVQEYVNADGFHTNTAESYFALLKRGVHGTFHHVSPKHLSRYCDEFSFRWNGRKLEDTERTAAAISGAEGKRLMYKNPATEA
jgi:transposase-like protein